MVPRHHVSLLRLIAANEFRRSFRRRSVYPWAVLLIVTAGVMVQWNQQSQRARSDATIRQQIETIQSDTFLSPGRRSYLPLEYYQPIDYPAAGTFYHNRLERFCSVFREVLPENQLYFTQRLRIRTRGVGRNIDLFFVFVTVLSFFAVITCFDAFTREREWGLLALVFANPIRRVSYYLVKSGVRLLLALVPLLLMGVSLVVGWIADGPLIRTPDDGRSLAGFWLAAALYVSCFALLTLAVSATATRSVRSLSISLILWIALVLVYPNLAIGVVQTVHSRDTYDMKVASFFSDTTRQNGERRLLDRLTWLSPADHFERLCAGLAGKDLTHTRHSISNARRNYAQYRQWRERKEKALLARYPGLKWDGKDGAKYIELLQQIRPDFQDRPRVSHPAYSLVHELGTMMDSLVFFLVINLGLLLGGLVRFLRTDLRRGL